MKYYLDQLLLMSETEFSNYFSKKEVCIVDMNGNHHKGIIKQIVLAINENTDFNEHLPSDITIEKTTVHLSNINTIEL